MRDSAPNERRDSTIRPIIACAVALLLLLLAAGETVAQSLQPAGLFADSMVLQRDATVPIWGIAAPGETVTVSFAGQTKTAQAGADGKWSVKLDAMPANGRSQELMIRDARETKAFKDVVVGDVWLCSGQSNMAFRMSEVANSAQEIAAAKNPGVRFFRVTEKFAQEPVTEVKGEWKQISPDTAADCSAVAYYFAQAVQQKLGVPIGLLVSSIGGTRIETWTARETLTDLGLSNRLLEKWKDIPVDEFERILTDYRAHQHHIYRERPALVRAAKEKGEPIPPEPKRPALRGHDAPSALHNGMIAPLQPFAIRGVLWYQGEANVGAPGDYPALQSALIADWRAAWGAELPFLFVQLAPHRTATPGFREAQFRAWQETPHTAMVVTTDVGDAQNIHPTRKGPVGERLALAALALAYGQQVEYSGPVFSRMTIDGHRATISFRHAGGGLRVKGGALQGFTLAGADGKFVAARAEIQDSTVVVTAEGIDQPAAVRFGWANVPDVNLYNRAGLPAVPFRTDLSPLGAPAAAAPPELSGIYPHLAMFNPHSECGTGAVVPWADKLWVVTYAAHYPNGSQDKLYSITRDLTQTIHPESIGGTPANRMIHRESDQLFIGPYAVSRNGVVRPIPYQQMPGRPTGNARHLFDPAGKIYYATMEEGFYEVDVKTLAVTELFADSQKQSGPPPAGRRYADLPGYHGKGFYSGQGMMVYSNNGEKSREALSNPRIPSGVLAEWDGKAAEWTIVRRNQFVEVTGPGGIEGNSNPATDPIWATGWDNKSVILALREPAAGWIYYRLPKASHSYDGAHGWNTEWPRIRDIAEDHYLMTMHGTFWNFPKTFGSTSSAGISPRSNHLKVIGDFARWGDHVVFGCDDVAKNEFLNKRAAKGEIAAAQSQSNLWFVKSAQLDALGPVIGRGMVWENEEVSANTSSDPFLFSGYDQRGLHIAHANGAAVSFVIEVDPSGTGEWKTLREISARPYTYVSFDRTDAGVWIRLRAKGSVTGITAAFSYRNDDPRTNQADQLFDGLAKPGQPLTGGIVRALDGEARTMAFAATDATGASLGYYELDEKLELKPVQKEGEPAWTDQHAAMPANDFLIIDEASVLFLDQDGTRWRLPKGEIGRHPLGNYRVAREIVTERDIFNADGTLYELPARNAGGFIKIRPVATHNRLIHDLGGYRGLIVMSGVATDAPAANKHILRSTDGKTALWAGVIDDLWQLGKPRGIGGPWKDTSVEGGIPSDPYLMTAYDKKSLTLTSSVPVTITAEIDITGNGDWASYMTFEVKGHANHVFPDSFSAYWIRFRSDKDCQASVTLVYD